MEVTFATPYAIFIFSSSTAPRSRYELDEAARIDGASPPQIFFKIYLPLMAPALVAIGTYALLLSWNEYLYAFLLLSSEGKLTVPVGLGKFLNSDEAPWNYLMAAAIVYAIPPMVIYYAFRRKDEQRPDHGRRQGLNPATRDASWRGKAMTKISRRHAIAGLGAVGGRRPSRAPDPPRPPDPVTVWWTPGLLRGREQGGHRQPCCVGESRPAPRST